MFLSERDGWRHAYRLDLKTGQPRLVTSFAGDVLEKTAVDQAGGWFYFLASPDDPVRQYLYRSRLDGEGTPERVTPSDEPGVHTYDIAPNGKWAVHKYGTADSPTRVEIVSLPDHKVVRTLVDNDELAAKVQPLLSSKTEFFTVKVGNGVRLDGWMLKPKNFDPSKKYPLLMYVYGEPAGAQVIDERHGDRMLFHRALADAGYVVGCVDNRGTPAPKGREWRKIIYGTVGVLASKEQAAAVRKLLSERPYLDGDRVASWGWSGGGSITLNLMFRSRIYTSRHGRCPVPDQSPTIPFTRSATWASRR